MPWPKPRRDDRPTTPMRLARFQSWARWVTTCRESEIRPFDPNGEYPDPGESGVMPAVREVPVMRPRLSSSGMFHALKVKGGG